MVHVEVDSTKEVGDQTHLAHGGAVVVDPRRDIDRVERLLFDRGRRCALVLETNVRNDLA